MSKSFKLNNGTLMLSTEAPGGIYNSSQLKTIASISESDSAIVKATEDQRLALFVKEELAEKVAEELKACGIGIRHYKNGLHQPTSCVGELCPDHQQDALGAAMAITEELSDIDTENPVKIGVNGCFQCCVPCHTSEIAIMGEDEGYRISIGGKNTQIPEIATFVAEGVPIEKLPGLVRDIVVAYNQDAEDDESLIDVIERLGTSKFVEILSPYSQDAAGTDDVFGGFESSDSSPTSEPENNALGLDLEELPEESDALNLDELPEETDELAFEIDPSDNDSSLDMADAELEMEETTEATDLNPSELNEVSGELDDIDLNSIGGDDELDIDLQEIPMDDNLASDVPIQEDDSLPLDDSSLNLEEENKLTTDEGSDLDAGDNLEILASSDNSSDDLEMIGNNNSEFDQIEEDPDLGMSNDVSNTEESTALETEGVEDFDLEDDIETESISDELNLEDTSKDLELMSPEESFSTPSQDVVLEDDDPIASDVELADDLEDLDQTELETQDDFEDLDELAVLDEAALENLETIESDATQELEPSAPPSNEVSSEQAVEEKIEDLSEADEGDFESKLSDDIATFENVEPEDTEIKDTRDQTLTLIENSEPADASSTLDIEEGELEGGIDIELDDFDEADTGIQSDNAAPSASKGWQIEGVDFLPSGEILFKFSGGAEMQVAPHEMNIEGEKVLTLGTKIVKISTSGNSFIVDVDGVKLKMPSAA